MNSIHKRGIAALMALTFAAAALHAGEAAPPAQSAAQAQARAQAQAQAQLAQAQAQQAQSKEQTELALAEAQKRLEAAAREVGELSAQLGNQMGNRYIFTRSVAPARAQLGVQIDNSPSKDGAHVLSVSPGGPAAEAGIRTGDVITAIGGDDLTKSSNPGRSLVERVQELQPDLKVKVTVARAGKKMDFDVTPRPMPLMAGMARMQPMPGMPPGVRNFRLQGPPGQQFEWHGNARGPGDNDPGMRFRGMEFATLSEKLGNYFGVKSGVLVVRTGRDDSFKLQDGDVILAIDGREPGNAQHAGRILRSYQGGEKLTLRVQRDRKPQNIEVTLPGGRPDDRSGDNDNDE